MQTITKISNNIKTAWGLVLDAIFPTFCLACKTEGRGWCCDLCWLKLKFIRALRCPDCGQASSLGKFCANCEVKHSLTGLWVSQNYGDPIIRALIRGLKYDGVKDVAPRLADVLVITMQIFGLPPVWHPTPRFEWELQPVPLSAQRERARGFNQAKLLSALLTQQINLPVVDYLRRKKFNKAQVDLPEAKRAQNVKGAFALKPNANVTGKTIILLDDVYTSGATMEECAKVLKTAGAREVWGLVIAKG
ncbi:TPA: hypothetical protein DEB72_01420 [Patescibacteria group bacterium]|nr:hypothetical protein [Patescibacteria group bacterium]